MKIFPVALVCTLVALLYPQCQANEVNARNYCPVQHCTELENELERWDCIGRHLYNTLEPGVDPLNGFYMQHDCHRVGWGNSVRGFFVTAFMALLTGRRLTLYHSQFNRMFSPPYDASAEWDYGLERRLAEQEAHAAKKRTPAELRYHLEMHLSQRWDYSPASHAERVQHWQHWTTALTDTELADTSKFKKYFTAPVMLSSMCGGSNLFVDKMDCLKWALPKFYDCLVAPPQQPGKERGLPMSIGHSVPAFYFSFRRPGPLLIKNIQLVRLRLGLPQLQEGMESAPGQWGIRTPGVYLLALHFRSIPVGFEPLGVDMQRGKQGRRRKELLHAFWVHAKKSAEHAKAIAACRGEELMIYLATDDPYNLRSVAEEKLGHIGRVVFGLDIDDVGHMTPYWNEKHHKNVQQVLRTGSLQGIRGDPSLAGDVNKELNVPQEQRLSYKDFSLHLGDRSEKAQERHGDWAITEWFLLSNAHWLIGHSGSAFAETAAILGLSPLGAMERFDMIHELSYQATSYRNDWDGADLCRVVHAADPQWRETCPNIKIPYTWDKDKDEL